MKNALLKAAIVLLIFNSTLISCSKDDSHDASPTLRSTSKGNSTQSATTSWYQLPGAAVEIDVAANGFAFVLGGAANEANGRQLFWWSDNNTNGNWQYVPSGGGIDLTCTFDGFPILVNNQGKIYYKGNQWRLLNFGNPPAASAIAANDVTFGGNVDASAPYGVPDIPSNIPALYILGTTTITGGHPVYKYDNKNNTWVQLGSQGAIRITIDVYNRPWIVSSDGGIYNAAGNGQTFNGWIRHQGLAVDICPTYNTVNAGMAVLGMPWGQNTSDVYWMPENLSPSQYNWMPIGGYGQRIAARGDIWLIAADNSIWRTSF